VVDEMILDIRWL